MPPMRSLIGLSLLWCALILAALPGDASALDKGASEASRFTAETFKGLEWRGIGPALMSGRVADIAIDPRDQSTWYVAVGSGNLWKTTNAGTTWTPVFDDQGSYSIGCVTIDPNNPSVVWVGTGENVGGRHVGYGDGVYRSRDGGATWERVGLETSEHVAKIVVDPRDSDVVYVAAQGPLWSAGGERGLYRTIDGGVTWQKILGGGDYTGVTDLVMDPRDPDVLYAATHQRSRTVAALINGGPESGIHASFDGGTTWHELEKGLPEEDMGRIGLAISPQRPDVLYATIELAHRKGGFWRSEDRGESWEKMGDRLAGGTGPHYYQEIFASPHAFDRIYQMDVRLHTSSDGGRTWTVIQGEHSHVDNHALAFDPNDSDYLLVGCDGGLYESWDLGATWKYVANLPVTQFYKVAVDSDQPFYNVYGGTQDNSTQGGPSRTDNDNGIRNSDWFLTVWADGHQPAVDPSNPDIVYSEWQQGNLIRFDRVTGEVVYIQPQPEADEPWDRFNWDAPILISPHDPARLFYASQRVWRSDDRGDSWRPISGDLTRGLDRLTLPMMERVWSFDAVWDLDAMSKYGTITSLSQSPLDQDLIYAGTDDGLVQVTEDGGTTWRAIDGLPGVPGFFFVNDIKADLFDADTVYLVVDNHKTGDFSPYVLASSDRGRSWRSIAGDLPGRHIVWRIVQDHIDPGMLFVGTEFGVFFTRDGGGKWVGLAGGVPTIPFRDLAIQRRENDLVGASFGRGIYILDDYSPLRRLSAETLDQEALLFPVRDAWWYIPRRPLGGDDGAEQGDAFFTAPNPPFGAVVTYYLKDELKSMQAQRRDREKEVEKQGGDTPYPGWDALREEELAQDPAILLFIRDADGNVVRRLIGPVTSGFHRVAWDLRYPSWEPVTPDAEPSEDDEQPAAGILAAPGSYTVSLAKWQNGVATELGSSQAFEVIRMRQGALAGTSPDERVAFMIGVAELERDVLAAGAAIDEAQVRLASIKQALMRSTVVDTSLDAEAQALERQLADLELRLVGDPRRNRLGDPGPVSIERRLQVVSTGNQVSTYGPTATHRRSLEIATEGFAEVRTELDRLLEVELRALEDGLDAAGVPWTPGRGVPGGR